MATDAAGAAGLASARASDELRGSTLGADPEPRDRVLASRDDRRATIDRHRGRGRTLVVLSLAVPGPKSAPPGAGALFGPGTASESTTRVRPRPRWRSIVARRSSREVSMRSPGSRPASTMESRASSGARALAGSAVPAVSVAAMSAPHAMPAPDRDGSGSLGSERGCGRASRARPAASHVRLPATCHAPSATCPGVAHRRTRVERHERTRSVYQRDASRTRALSRCWPAPP